VVFTVRPVIDAETATGVVPDPGEGEHGALDPYDVVAPHSTRHSLTALPFGFTVAFSVAEADVMDDADPVATVGRVTSVVNVLSDPLLVPPELVTTILKW
jgi:hypothetical protein